MKLSYNLQIINIKDKELYSMLMGSDGGRTRMKIIDEILIKPCNANQLSKRLKLDYKTITYHLDIICSHRYMTREKFEKKTYYYPGDRLIKNIEEYIDIRKQIDNE
ncbi:winged helix-turn-helix domain-containing protein [Methanobrevibacter sp.]|jgi:predicted transcriptional regulator|uniref:winged helix-turn-helix domain-containing protein n=1 Tax=Methanobrevibacter sp. TaxID=66852 RepID=UPI00386A86CF